MSDKANGNTTSVPHTKSLQIIVTSNSVDLKCPSYYQNKEVIVEKFYLVKRETKKKVKFTSNSHLELLIIHY